MMPELGSIHIRRMLPGDFDQVISLRAKYRQQLGIGALNTLWKLDPEGIFVAVTEDGELYYTYFCFVASLSSLAGMRWLTSYSLIA